MNKNKLRSSQVVSTFGPGAMVDLPDSSAIVSGLDYWHYDLTDMPVIHEARLVRKLQSIKSIPNLTLRQPPPSNDQPQGFHPAITAWRFPEWFIVQHAVTSVGSHRRRRLVHLNSLSGERFRDGPKTYAVVPVRFVQACEAGHIDDINWRSLVHGHSGDHCGRDLWIEERGTSGDLDETVVLCECGAERSMSLAARRELKLLGHCSGRRPWLGPGTRDKCGRISRLLIRSASNAYFPQKLSVISIPDLQNLTDDIVRSAWDAGLSLVDSPDKLAFVRQIPAVATKIAGLEDQTVFDAINRIRQGSGIERPVKEVEFEALAAATDTSGSDQADGDFMARAMPSSHWRAPWMTGISRVVLVHRLREVVAQLGFTRFESVGTNLEGELDLDVTPAPLAIDTPWLPASENRGEGIFLQFDAAMIETWQNRPEVVARGQELLAGFSRWKADHPNSTRNFFGLPFYLLHTFSHLLLTAIALECGYPSSSLRERVFALPGTSTQPGRYGVLIYTGSPDAEGTLGGLVLAGRDISRHVQRALELGTLCSNDPVCAQHHPGSEEGRYLAGSACHGCVLVAETSCEQSNEFLDRALVVPVVHGLGCAFFPRVL
jgi:hypothetical protein